MKINNKEIEATLCVHGGGDGVEGHVLKRSVRCFHVGKRPTLLGLSLSFYGEIG